jgi:hypothetical protein
LSNHKKVIPFPNAPVQQQWTYFDFGDEIENWYGGLSEGGQDVFDALLKANAKASLPLHWGGCKMLQGDCKEEKIWEWRFFADGKQQRLLGVFGQKQKTAIFLIGCSHKDEVYNPSECLATAIKRAKQVKQGAKLNERKVRTNL